MVFAEVRIRSVLTDSKRPDHRGGIWWPHDPGPRPADIPSIDVVIPALNEERSLPLVLEALPEQWIRTVVVVDNGSSDQTAAVAGEAGAIVVDEPQRGYGAACFRGIQRLRRDPPKIVVFIDADYSDVPQELPRLVAPIICGEAELVIGSRTIGAQERGALLPQAVVGNKLACLLMEFMYGYRFSDLGPFRAITWQALEGLQMRDRDFGWTVEMQIKAARQGLAAVEVPVSYRKRVGVSKITGTVRGTVLASYKILYTLMREYFDQLIGREQR